jgi:hypothetical protein
MQQRERTTTASQPHVEMFLAGDFSSPAEVLASELTKRQKREILEFWRDDLGNKLEIGDARVLLSCIYDALQSLDAPDQSR